MNYKLHTTSWKAWDAMLSAIKKAKKSIYIEMYIFLDDTKDSHNFIDKLKKKASRGVEVIVVVDAFGSKDLKKEVIRSMKNVGIEFIFFSHWLRHIHRKILVVDEKTAFVGGVNIGKRFASWHDLQLELKGGITKRILSSFAYTYEMAGGKKQKILNYRKRKFTNRLRFWLIEHWPIKNIYSMKSHYVEKITAAQKSIQIVTPYFSPPRWLISLLDDALRRNVRVEILLPAKVDWRIMNKLNYHYMHELSALGVKFYLAPKMNHAKLLLIDGKAGLLGSQNVDLLSFNLNAEVGLFFKEPKLLAELTVIVEEWKKKSEEFKPIKRKLNMGEYLLLFLLKIFKPIL